MNKEHKFLLMDGRAWFDVDKAVVFEVCDSIEEARENKKTYGDAVVVKAEAKGDQLSNLKPIEIEP
ncbi:MAG: hypothetical protein QY310_04140 [Candidatus Jettenia sp. CY-1]|nr:MAG: hypothetical protein QY310_04140 [Candidatus Jettenia sp. CY-1]